MTDEAFLRACLRADRDPSAAGQVRARSAELERDADAFLEAIDAERLGPLLYRRAGKLGILPAVLVEALHARYRLTGVRNLVLLRELGSVLAALAAARIPVIVLKGAALIELVYRHVALRPMCDADLLVRQDDLPAAQRVIEALGYAIARAETHPGVLAEYENEIVYFRTGSLSAPIDLHWSLFDSPYYQRRVAMDWFWESAESSSIGGVPALVLGPEALLVHLCGHLALHHAALGLLWWNDIAEVLTQYGQRIDWTRFVSTVEQLGVLLPVRTVLTRSAEEWHAPLPEPAVWAMACGRVSPDERRAFDRVSAGEQPVARRFWADLASMPEWRQRLRFARTNLFPSAEYMRRRYRIPYPFLLPLYYPYRWLRGLRGV
jgi:hypothetical protein